MALTNEEQQELALLEAVFEGAGGRGVDLAERLDDLRARRDRDKYLITIQAWVYARTGLDAEGMAIDVANHAEEINEDPDAPKTSIQTCVAQQAPFAPLGDHFWTGTPVEIDGPATPSTPHKVVSGEWLMSDPNDATAPYRIGFEVEIRGSFSGFMTGTAPRRVMEAIITENAKLRAAGKSDADLVWTDDGRLELRTDDGEVIDLGTGTGPMYELPGWAWQLTDPENCLEVVKWWPTVEEYADYVYEAIERDFGPVGIKMFTDFSELHDVVDANEYLIEADEHFGTSPFAGDDWARQEAMDFINGGTDLVSQRLKAGARHQIAELRHIHD